MVKHKELLNIQTSVGGNGNKENSGKVAEGEEQGGEELIHREKVEGSPLWIVGNKEHGYFVAMGNHRLTESAKTVVEAREKLVNEQYNIIANMVVQIVGTMNEVKEAKSTVNDMYKEGIEVNK